MAVMVSELYDALKEAGASEEKARAAATSVAAYEERFNRIERDLTLLKWMVGGVYVLGAPAIWLMLKVAAKVGALG